MVVLVSRVVLLLLLLALPGALAACDDGGGGAPAQRTANPPLDAIDLRHEAGTLRVEVARSGSERALGLGGRASLDADAGMLFDLGGVTIPSFYMRGMQFPLDMLFIDNQQRVVSITPDVRPEPGVPDNQLRRYTSSLPVRYVLELNAGAAARLGIETNDQLHFELPE